MSFKEIIRSDKLFYIWAIASSVLAFPLAFYMVFWMLGISMGKWMNRPIMVFICRFNIIAFSLGVPYFWFLAISNFFS